jgi:hypothetical protein
MHLMAACRQLDPELGTDNATATVGGITCNPDFHEALF